MAKKVNVQQKFTDARARMDSALIERGDEIDVVLTALIAQEHPLLVGPPGTAKSMLLDSLLDWMDPGATRFSVCFNKFTTPEEVFGPISVAGLKADEYRRITAGKLPEATVAFADEIFKASSAILNTMLRILNERAYENGDGSFRKVPLKICVAASNEWPNDDNGGKELGALFDRFLFRKIVRPVSRGKRDKLLWSANVKPTFDSTISPTEIDQANREAMALDFSDDAKDGLVELLDQLNAEGIFPGDRRMRKSINAAKAFAFLRGEEDEVQVEHLEILKHVLWDDPTEQPAKCGKIVGRLANPVGSLILDKLTQTDEIVEKSAPTDAVPKLQAIQKELKALSSHPDKDSAVEYVGTQIKAMYNKVIGA